VFSSAGFSLPRRQAGLRHKSLGAVR
jgi:hypothetical protein